MISAQQRTIAILKPDALSKKAAGAIIARVESAGFEIENLKMLRLTPQTAAEFYKDHTGKPFFEPLIAFMSSGPIIVMVLKAVNAISRWRDLMGPTDPSEAIEGQLRKVYGTNVRQNACHGSDSTESADREIFFFFGANGILNPGPP